MLKMICRFTAIFCFIFLTACFNFEPKKKSVAKDSILLLKVKGVIDTDMSENLMEHVRKYMGKDRIKGLLMRINSPGGTVGASQEINSLITEVRQYYKKPVFVSGGDKVTSGALYSIMSADKIFVNEGTLFGSIGVLMEFHNYSELMRWAKIDAYHLKAGEFKDQGTPYRQMTLRERELFENLLETALTQFKEAIITGRKLTPKAVEAFADGRIFTGKEAFELGLVDSIGSFNQAIRAIGEATGLGSSPHLFDPGAKTAYEKFFSRFTGKSFVADQFLFLFNKFEKLAGQSLYILPSYISPQY